MKNSTKVFWLKLATIISGFAATLVFVFWCVLNALCAFGNVPVPMYYHILVAISVLLVLAAVICNLKKENIILKYKRIHRA